MSDVLSQSLTSQSPIVGQLQKMKSQLADPVVYQLLVGEQLVSLNELLGKQITLKFLGAINCIACGRKTNKSFNQGYCFPCFKKLPQCDSCIMSPEKCHYEQGTCRDAAWGEQFCMTGHIVYLANSSGVKVGITRLSQVPTRWIDQGATQALPIMRVATRQQSGLIEAAMKSFVADKTNWRTMLKGTSDEVDLVSKQEELFAQCAETITSLQQQFGVQALQPVTDAKPLVITYPVLQHPEKVTALNFDKQAEITGTLLGIKGQYLIMDIGVLNIRKFTAYNIQFSSA
ncbi:DUF2797 domain-containing protein [Zooshikella harenae]|nr:DUF2797 domain-containing protein [Zooshikella harenae]